MTLRYVDDIILEFRAAQAARNLPVVDPTPAEVGLIAATLFVDEWHARKTAEVRAEILKPKPIGDGWVEMFEAVAAARLALRI
jgi:hypothetical protein